MLVQIRTADTKWAARAARRYADGVAVVEIADADVERLTFGPRNAAMVRFDLQAAHGKLPRDCWNRWNMIPAAHVVTEV